MPNDHPEPDPQPQEQSTDQTVGDEPVSIEVLQQQIASLTQELTGARETIDSLERRQKIDALLAEQEAVDIEAARLLTEVAVAEMPEADLQQAVNDLKRHRPYLFRGRASAISAGVMAPRIDPDTPGPVEAAEQAARSGDRRDLLRYLRLRRQRE